MTEAYTEAKGIMINSGDWNGMESSVLKKEAPEMIEKMGFGKKTTNYKLRDWVFSPRALLGRANSNRTLSGLWSSSGSGRRASITVTRG